MSDSEASVFNYHIDDEDILLPHPKKARKICERACAWTFQDRRHCSQLPLVLQELKIERQIPFKSSREEVLCIMGEKLLSKIYFIAILLNCDSLESECEEYEIPLRCYIQTSQIRKSALQSRFQANASWEP